MRYLPMAGRSACLSVGSATPPSGAPALVALPRRRLRCGGVFSVQARPKSKAKGHFNYTSTDGTFKVRCKAFDTFAPNLTAKTAAVPFKNCTITGHPTVKTLTVNVVDRGNPPDERARPSVPVARDSIGFDVGRSYSGNLTDGNIKVR